MLSFPLKNFAISPYPLSISLKNSSFPFPNTCKYNNKIHTATLSISLSLIWLPLKKQSTLLRASSSDSVQEQEYQVLAAVRSEYNEIVIVDTPKERMLLLDSTHNVHSILNKEQKWTGSYWDEFASLPAIIPKGPIAILGLGGGTAAHLMLDLWPSLQLEGWEIDPILIDKARQHFGLSDLEKHTTAGGILHVHIGDALASSQNYSGRYAGIVIDLFYEGKVLAELQEVATWLELNDRLMAGGRFMVNCGGINNEKLDNNNADSIWVENSTIKALSEAFPGKVCWKRMAETQGFSNYLALTGPLPDLTLWSSKLSYPLSQTVRQWSPCASIA